MRYTILRSVLLPALVALGSSLWSQQATSLITGKPALIDATQPLPGRLLPAKGRQPNWTFDIKPEHVAYRHRFRARSVDAIPGALSWQQARIDIRFTDAKNKDVAWVKRFNFTHTRDWQYYDVFYTIPQGATRVSANPQLFGGQGQFEIADVDFIAYDQKALETIAASELNVNLLTPDILRSIRLPSLTTAENGTVTFTRPDASFTLHLPIHRKFLKNQGKGPGKLVRLTGQARAKDTVGGEAAWQHPFISLAVTDNTERAHQPPRRQLITAVNDDWQDIDLTVPVADDLPFIELALGNLVPKTGTCEFRNLALTLLEEPANLPPPDGSTIAQCFSLEDAWKGSSETRSKICLNGLWQFQPVFKPEDADEALASAQGWGWFKVPASWPDLVQTWRPYSHSFNLPTWINKLIRQHKNILHYAWYQRQIAIPKDWNGKRCLVDFELFQGKGAVYIDGKQVAPIAFPGGSVDITKAVVPGKTHLLQVWISTEPYESSIFMGMTREYKKIAEQNNKGICGDVFLCAVPMNHEMQDVRIETSVKNRTITLDVGFTRLPAGTYTLDAIIARQGKTVKTISAKPFSHNGSQDFRHSFTAEWKNPLLWDTDRPDNLYTLTLSLRDAQGKLLDQLLDETFGFREFELRGRDFYLNGTRIHLRALPINHTAFPAHGTRDVIDHLVKQAKKLNLNFFFDGDKSYNFRVGTNCYDRSFREELSRHGILSSLAMPHAVSDFQANLHDPKIAAAYKQLCAYRIRRYQNLPGIVLYSANHNALGHADMQNPISMGTDWRPDGDKNINSKRYCGLMSEKIINSIDPTRAVYHHDAGNLGRISAQNFYLNWAPMQERSDWLEPWEKHGTMPIIFVEYGIPHIASWSSFRGPGFIWRVKGVQGTMLDEFNAETLGEKVYAHHPIKEKLFGPEEKRAKNNTPTNFVTGGLVTSTPSTDELRSTWLWHNLRDMRARGLSGFQPWDASSFFVRTQRGPNGPHPQRFHNLKHPGSVADRIVPFHSMLASPYDVFEPNQTGLAFMRGCLPLLAWISGKPDDFTERAITFTPGETVQKSLTLLNDTRRTQTIHYAWNVAVANQVLFQGQGDVTVEPGGRATVPVTFEMPAANGDKHPVITANFTFADGSQPLQDALQLTAVTPKLPSNIEVVGLWDPENSAQALLRQLQLKTVKVASAKDLKGLRLLVIGRYGLDTLPFDLRQHVRDGLRLLILEQKPERLNQLQIRYACQGLRTLFSLDPTVGPQLVHWRGSSTTRPYFPPGQEVNASYPKSLWNGIMNTHIWYCGQRGNIADILPEKPTRGNFLPMYHGGFDLQYAPLMLFQEGKAAVMLCQLNVSQRTAVEPQALNVLANAITRLVNVEPTPARNVRFAGAQAGKLLQQLGVPAQPFQAEATPDNALLVIQSQHRLNPRTLRDLVAQGTNILALGLQKDEILALDPLANVTDGTFYTDFATGLVGIPEFAGISNAELHLRYAEPFASFPAESMGGRRLQLVRHGKGRIVFFQVPPYQLNQTEFIKRTTVRRTQFAVSRLLANLGASAKTSFIDDLKPTGGILSEIKLDQGWQGLEDPDDKGRQLGYFKPEFQPRKWRSVNVGSKFNSQFSDLETYAGLFWYRKTFDLPAEFVKENFILNLGPVDDESWIWLDGKFLGEITQKTHPSNYWSAPRKFVIPAHTLKPGKHTLVVLCNELRMGGGITQVPMLSRPLNFSLYADTAVWEDDPYRYFHW